MVDLRAKGVKTVVIDPRFTPDAAKATVWLPIRPGTDVALMLAWIRYIIEHKLFDYEFVLKWTNLPFLVDTETKMFLRDGEDFVVWDTNTDSPKTMAYPWDDSLSPALSGANTNCGREYKTLPTPWERAEPFTPQGGGNLLPR